MSKQVLLDYDVSTGTLTEPHTGTFIGACIGLTPYEESNVKCDNVLNVESKREVTDVISHLKTMGIPVNTIQDLVLLKDKGLL